MWWSSAGFLRRLFYRIPLFSTLMYQCRIFTQCSCLLHGRLIDVLFATSLPSREVFIRSFNHVLFLDMHQATALLMITCFVLKDDDIIC